MILPPLSLLALWLASATLPAFAGTPGSFADGGDTLISAMMVLLFSFHIHELYFL